MQNNQHAINGPIIFQLTRVDPSELDIEFHDMTAEKWIQPPTTMMAVSKGVEHAHQPKQKLKSLTEAQLQNIKESLPPKVGGSFQKL